MRARFGVIAVAAVLTLTGCSGAVRGEPEVAETTPPATSAPLTAESPAAAPTGEVAYLDAVREALPDNTVIPNATDEQLLAAGEEACKVLDNGEDTMTVSLIDGEPKNGLGYYQDSGAIITAAATTLCG